MIKPTYIDIFAGCGGLSLGLYNSGWQGLFAIEKNKDAFETLEYNLIQQREHFCWKKWLPLQNLDINEVLKQYNIQLKRLKGRVPLVVGGPPCQGFSTAGKRDVNDIRNILSTSYIEFINMVRPRFLLFENVNGFTVGFKENDKKRGIPYSEIVKQKLENLGYKISHRVIDLSEYGIPQKRKRFIMVGCLYDNPNDFFEILKKNKELFLISKNLKSVTTVKDAIGDLLKEFGEVDTPDFRNYKSGVYGDIETNYQRLMRVNIHQSEDLAVNSHRFTKHSKEIKQLNMKMLENCPRLRKIEPCDKFVEGLKKRGVTILDENDCAPTVTTHPDDILHYSEPRILTVRELARIQSFPDDFEFKGKYTTGGERRKSEVPRYTQVGNAVPPLFAEQAGIALMEMMNNAK